MRLWSTCGTGVVALRGSMTGRVVVGLITAYDIAGEKPMQYMQTRAILRREVLVATSCRKSPDAALADIKQ